MRKGKGRMAAALLAVVLWGCASSKGPYPTREVKLVVQASPGGISDTVSRVIASVMEKRLRVPVVCENKPGAAGALAFSYVVRQAPDGYTLGHGPVEIAMVRTLGFADIGPKDLELLCLVSKVQPVLAVREDSAWKTFSQFVEAVRARTGYYVVANSGTGSIWHINALLMEQSTGMRVVHCPFAGSSGALTALLGGHVDAAVAGSGEVAPHVEAGRMRVLAVFDQSRSHLFPDAPAVQEAGYQFGVNAWSGFIAPKGLGPEVRDTLVSAIRSAFESREFQQVCRERGLEPAFLDSDEFRQFAYQQASLFENRIPGLLGGKQ